MLHACCAPCSSHTLLYLYEYFDITVYFCNPNIAPENEYEFRKSELKRLISELELSLDLIDEDYDPNPFYELARGFEELPERGERCRRCIEYRLRKTGELAKKLGLDFYNDPDDKSAQGLRIHKRMRRQSIRGTRRSLPFLGL